VAEEDEGHHEAMKIGPWVARKREAFWEARFTVAIANCNAGPHDYCVESLAA
jgi:hypothetical protein